MPGSPQTEPLDDRLTDMGRALANSLLGDSSGRPVVERPVETVSRRRPQTYQRAQPSQSPPTPAAPPMPAAPQAVAPIGDTVERPAVVRRRNRPAAPNPYEGLPWLDEDAAPLAPTTAPESRTAPEDRTAARPADPIPEFPAPEAQRGPALEPTYEVAREVPPPRPANRTAAFAPAAVPAPTSRPAPEAIADASPTLAPQPTRSLRPESDRATGTRDHGRTPVAADRVTQELVVPDSPEPEVPPTRTARTVRSLIEWALVLGTAAIVALLLQQFVVQFYEIPSESMYPTLKEQDRVAVNKLSYSIGGGVERGDVIVFKRPASERTDDPDQPGQLIKRVIGLPGDVVEARSGVVYIDGKPLSETGDSGYLDPSVVTNNLPEPVTVPTGHVFVMGDNREHSRDSRFFGAVPESDIIGRAMAVAWPFNRFGTL